MFSDTISAALDETERSRSSAQNNQHEDDDNVRSSRRRNRKDKTNVTSATSVTKKTVPRNMLTNSTQIRARRNRRLNAQERRAAAEVELIESDLELDEIDYEPIEGDMPMMMKRKSFESSSHRPRRRSAMLQEAEESG